jgi:hypothetical protein
MSYGYRLNVEDIFMEAADSCWEKAQTEMIEIHDEEPKTAQEFTYRAPTTPIGISNAVQAVIGWAICFEAHVNFAWNETIAEKIPSPKLNKSLLRQLSSLEKAKEILKFANESLENKTWISGIKDLFELRNQLVHFKEPIQYTGFSFAPKFARDFKEEKLKRIRASLHDAVIDLSKAANIRFEFINGSYEPIHYDA